MTWLVALVGVLVAALGVLGVARPAALLEVVAGAWSTPRALGAAVAFRLLFGVAAIVAAPSSRVPTVLLAVGALSLVSGFAALALGWERALRFVGWWKARSEAFVRVWAGVALAFGVLLVWAVA